MTKKNYRQMLILYFSFGIAFELIGVWFQRGIAEYFAGMFIGGALIMIKFKNEIIK